MNKDEKLIRDAIANMPPESARSSAFSFFIICFCISYGAALGGSIGSSYSGMLTGILAGFVIGMFQVACISSWIRRRFWELKHRDGYQILDKVIRGSASGFYSRRRITPGRDVVQLAIVCGVVGGMSALLNLVSTDNIVQSALAALNGMGVALLIYFMVKVNLLGMLHGHFFVTPLAQWLGTGLLTSTTVTFIVLCFHFYKGCGGMVGAGANIGFLSGNLLLALATGHWKHVLGDATMITVMATTVWLSPFLWRENFLLMCGSIGILLLPEWHYWQSALVILAAALSIAGVAVIYWHFFAEGDDQLYVRLFCQSNLPFLEHK